MPNASQVVHNTGNDEWYTPPSIIVAARQTLGSISLDPATCVYAQTWIRAERFFTIADNALSQSWSADTVWMNPPYSGRKIGQFIDRFVGGFLSGEFKRGIVLTNSATETKWFQLATACSQGLLLFSSRIKFIPKEGGIRKTPLQGQVLFLFGDDNVWAKFSHAYSSFGILLKSV